MCAALVKIHFFVPPFKLGTLFLIESMTECHTVGTVGPTALIPVVVKLRKCYSLALFLFLCIRQALPVPSFDASFVSLERILGNSDLISACVVPLF